MREALVPKEKLLLGKSQILVGRVKDVLGPSFLVCGSKTKAPQPKTPGKGSVCQL